MKTQLKWPVNMGNPVFMADTQYEIIAADYTKKKIRIKCEFGTIFECTSNKSGEFDGIFIESES